MNYELAKELKAAGWPQNAAEGGSYYSLPIGYTFMREEWRKDLEQPKIPCRIPNLEELIEACGRAFRSLTWHSDGSWDAYVYSSINEHGGKSFYGSTPSGAVAKLWLAINSDKSETKNPPPAST